MDPARARPRLPFKDVKELWGHSGGIPGFTTLALATTRGAAATLGVNTEQTTDRFAAAITTIACAVA